MYTDSLVPSRAWERGQYTDRPLSGRYQFEQWPLLPDLWHLSEAVNTEVTENAAWYVLLQSHMGDCRCPTCLVMTRDICEQG